MQIFAKPLVGKSVTLEVTKDETILNVKKNIHEKTGLTPKEQKLLYLGSILEDHKTVDEYQITNKSTINVVKILRGIQIFVKTFDGKSKTLDVMKDDTILNLRKKIYDKMSLTPDEHKLVYQRSILEDEKTLDEWQIEDKSVILVRIRGMQIFAVTLDGKSIAFEVTKEDKVRDIKKKIEEKMGLSADEQILMYQGDILKDDKTLDDCQIEDQSMIAVRLHKMIIIVKTLYGKIVSFEVTKRDKVSDIKKKIEEKTGLSSDEQILMYQGGILEDDKTVNDCQITDQSIIVVTLRKLQIFVRAMDGKTVAFEVTKEDKVIDIKKKIEEKMGLSAYEQILEYQGGVLKDDKTVDKCQIEDQSMIVVRRRGAIQIFVRALDGKTVAFEVTKEDKVIDIKKKIEEKTGLSVDDQKLIYQGAILEDDKTVDDCQIMEKSVIYVVVRLGCSGIQIFAKTLDGKYVAFYLDKREKVSDIKKMIEEKTGLSPDEQKLIYQGGILEDDDKTVDDCQIRNQSVINVVVRRQDCGRL